MNTNDISIDCEGLGKAFDAPIIAIGAVAFDRTTGKLGAKFYEEIAIDSAIRSGRVDATTIAWWITQSSRAKAIFSTPDEKKKSLATVLDIFAGWMRNIGKGVPRPWFNGIAQDGAWLEHAYTVGGHGLTIPWGYNMARDMRGIVELAEEIADFRREDVPSVGTEHNGLDDAIYQANVVSKAYASLRDDSKLQAVLAANDPKKPAEWKAPTKAKGYKVATPKPVEIDDEL